MKSRAFNWVSILAVLATLGTTVRLSAQERQKKKPGVHHYKLFDMGTLGGPNSFPSAFGTLDINFHGLAIAEAETTIPDPFAPNCWGPPNCLVNHAIAFHNGVQTDLGALPGGNNSSIPGWVNNHGTAVGLSENGVIDPLTGNPEIRGVVWKDGKIFALGTLGGNASYANVINNRGQVVGFALNTIPDSDGQGLSAAGTAPLFFPVATQVRAVLWQDGVIHDLGTLGRGHDAVAVVLNDRGQVAGVSFTDTILNANGVPTQHPFFWEDGKMVDMGSFGGTIGDVNWMNNRGQVVGYSTLADGNNHASVWDKKEGLKDLGVMPGGFFSTADWINDAGEIVGFSDAASGLHAVLWKNGVMIDLGSVAGDICNFAQSINSQGQIVGFGRADCFNEDHAFLWENGGPPVDLQTLLVPRSDITLIAANVINDRGEIVGNGTLPNGDNHAVLLIPCDENHAGVEDCDYATVDAAAAAQATSAQSAPSPAAASFAKLSPAEQKARIRSFMARRNRRFGARLPN